jgi:hypothetical protein
MNKKPGLIPTVTTDKNGKITTVYKKPVGGSETNLVIPAPIFTKEASMGRTATISRTSSVVCETLSLEGAHAERIESTLTGYPDDLLTKLDHHFANDSHGTYFTAMAIDKKATHSFVNEVIAFGSNFQTDSTELAHCLIRSLHHYEQLPSMEDYSLAPKEVQTQCIAILAVTEALDDHAYFNDVALPIKYTPSAGDNDSDHTLLQGDDLIALILERPLDSDEIADIIIERQTSDVELIREIMSQDDSKALNSGIL